MTSEDIQNLAYAVTQIVHNFGAVTVVGGAACALAWRDAEAQRKLAWIVMTGWMIQAVSGATFGAISFAYYGKFPDIHGIAVAALVLKVICAVFGFSLAAWQVFFHPAETFRRNSWLVLCGLGVVALSSAAVLRWFS